MTITNIRPGSLLPPGCVDGFCPQCKRESVVSETDPRCPYCKRALDPRSLPAAPGDVRTVAQAVQSGDEPTPAPVEPVRAIAAHKSTPAAAQPVKTVTLPASRAGVAWSRATDAWLAEIETELQAAETAYEQAKARYDAARQTAHKLRQLRDLVRVDGAATTTPALHAPTANAKPWAKEYDACRICGDSTRKHMGRGRCTRCCMHFKTHGFEWPHKEAQTNGD